MDFQKAARQTPTNIGNVSIVLTSEEAKEESYSFTVPTPQTTTINIPGTRALIPNTITVTQDIEPFPEAIENIDYTIDYTAGTITPTASSIMNEGEGWTITFKFHFEYSTYAICILDQMGTQMEILQGQLEQHLSAGMLSNLESFLSSIRTQAQEQAL